MKKRLTQILDTASNLKVKGFASPTLALNASLTVGLTLLLSAPGALAAGGGHVPQQEPVKLQPAKRYSGNSPIDRRNGTPFSNGTFGLPNPTYEEWAKAPTIVPGVSEKTYPFQQKKKFVAGVRESLQFIEHAIWNWEQTSPDTKPEAVEYSKASIEKMKPLLERARETLAAAKSASRSEWDQAQADSRQALIDLRVEYAGLHKNVRR
jgi:hypothetical protein